MFGKQVMFLILGIFLKVSVSTQLSPLYLCDNSEDGKNGTSFGPSDSEHGNEFHQIAEKLNITLSPQIQWLNCSNSNIRVVSVSLEDAEQEISDSLTPQSNNSLNLNRGIVTVDSQEYFPQDFCISKLAEDEVEVRICHKNVGVCGPGCIRKCCGTNEAFFHIGGPVDLKCAPSDIQWKPTFYKTVKEKASPNETGEILKSLNFKPSHPREEWCEWPVILDTKQYENSRYAFRILENGTVLVKNHQYLPWRTLEAGTFCIDGVQRVPGQIQSEDDVIIVDCLGHVDDEIESNVILYAVFQGIACCFLFLTVFVYLVLWERQNIHSWTLLGYAITMLCQHGCFFTIYVHNHYLEVDQIGTTDTFCTCLGVITHFFYVSTFCWLTLINFDVWWTFKKLKLTIGGSKRKRHFFFYVLFAFLVPLAVVSIGLILDHLYRYDIESEVVFPEYGGRNCFVNVEVAFFYYMILPAAVLLGCNLVFFTMTIYTLHSIGESTKLATNKSSLAESSKPRFFLFVKLFFVMGLVLCLELVSYFAFGSQSTNPFVYVLDIIYILQPVAIFIIFVCKADILRGLQIKFPVLRRLFQLFGLKQIPSRYGTGTSNVSVATQFSTCSARSQTVRRDISMKTMTSMNPTSTPEI